MKFTKIFASTYLTLLLSVCLAAPPRIHQVVEMKEDQQNAEIKVNEKPETVLKVDEIEPQDHLDAVRLEQDGMINKDYKKEIFIGEHEEIDRDESDIAESKLKDIYMK